VRNLPVCVPIQAADLCCDAPPVLTEQSLLNPKYKLPAECFAYVPEASQPKTWTLIDHGRD
jgi:hypothetical protein